MQTAPKMFLSTSLESRHQQFRWIPIRFQAYAHPHLTSTAGANDCSAGMVKMVWVCTRLTAHLSGKLNRKAFYGLYDFLVFNY
jgi:hypothetical protein